MKAQLAFVDSEMRQTDFKVFPSRVEKGITETLNSIDRTRLILKIVTDNIMDNTSVCV